MRMSKKLCSCNDGEVLGSEGVNQSQFPVAVGHAKEEVVGKS
jgi:hypothetical protein